MVQALSANEIKNCAQSAYWKRRTLSHYKTSLSNSECLSQLGKAPVNADLTMQEHTCPSKTCYISFFYFNDIRNFTVFWYVMPCTVGYKYLFSQEPAASIFRVEENSNLYCLPKSWIGKTWFWSLLTGTCFFFLSKCLHTTDWSNDW